MVLLLTALAALVALAALLCALSATAEQLSLADKVASALGGARKKGSGHETTTASPTLRFPVACLCPCAFGPGACSGDLEGTPDCLACLAANPYACHATPTGC